MLSDPETRPLLLKSIMGEARPAGVNDPPAEDVSAGTFGGTGGGGQYVFLANGATTTPLTVKGAASQSVPLQNWKNSAGDVLATVQGNGSVGIGTPTPGARLDVNGEVSAPVIKETATEYSGADITDYSPRKVFFNVPGSGNNVLTYYKIATVKVLGTYSNVHFYGWLDTGGSHVGVEKRMEVEVRVFTMAVATDSTLVYSKRGQNTEYFCAYKIEDGDGSGHDYYDLYVKQRWWDNTSGEIDIRVGCGTAAVTVWQTGSNCGTGTPGGALQSPNANYAVDTAGNVGIGTTGPETPLMVVKANSGSGALTPVLKVQSDGSSGEGPMVKFAATLAQNVAKAFIAYQSTGGGYGGNGKLLLGVNPATDTTDVSASDAKVAIQGDGKVGIGTTSPRGRLEVVSTVPGDVSFWTLSKNIGEVNDAQNIIFAMPNAVGQVNSTAGLRAVIEAVDATNARTGLGFITGQHDYTAERMRITGGGNVGIGTTTPVSKLHVRGRAAFTASGTVTALEGQSTVTGTDTAFLEQVGIGDRVTIETETRSVLAIADGNHLTVDGPFDTEHSGKTMTVHPSLFRVDDSSGATQFLVNDQGRGLIPGLNQIVFLKPKGGSEDDSAQINNAIESLPDEGGIIMLTPGPYNIHTTIEIKNNGVKLRGYGGAWLDGAPATKLLWVGGDGDPVPPPDAGFLPEPHCPIVKVYSTDPTKLLQDVELSGFAIDGNGRANLTGLLLNQVGNSTFRRVQVANVVEGFWLTTSASAADVGCQYNFFENCSARVLAKGAVLTRTLTPEIEGQGNSCHNTFIAFSAWYSGTQASDAGIWLLDCDNNNFIRTYCWPSVEGSGFGVVIADPRNARANYFYHLQAWPRVRLNKADAPFVEQKNVIFGYDLENTQLQPEAVTSSGNPADPANFLFWIDSAASVNASELAVTEKMSKAAGAVYASANQSSVHGADTGPDRTYFTRDVSVGDKVTIVAAPTDPHPETRTVTAVNSDFLLTVDSSFTYDHGWGLLAVWPCLRLALRVADPWGGTKLSLSNAGNLSVAGSLSIGSAEVVSDQRVLHNVTANAGIITSGAFQPSQIPNLDASKVTSGTFQAVQIPNLNASKINDGIFDLARIPTMDNAHLPGDLLHGKTADGRKIAWGAAHLSSGSASVGTGLSTIEAALVTAINGTSNTFNADHSAGGGALTIGCSDGSSTEWVWWIAIGT